MAQDESMDSEEGCKEIQLQRHLYHSYTSNQHITVIASLSFTHVAWLWFF